MKNPFDQNPFDDDQTKTAVMPNPFDDEQDVSRETGRPEGKTSTFWKVMDILNRPSSATMGILSKGIPALLNPGQALLHPLDTASNALEGAKRGIQGLTGEKQFTGSDVIGEATGWHPDTTAGKFAKGGAGFVLQALTDPLNAVGIGALSKLGKAGEVGGLARRALTIENPFTGVTHGLLPEKTNLLGGKLMEDAASGLRNIPGVRQVIDAGAETFGYRPSTMPIEEWNPRRAGIESELKAKGAGNYAAEEKAKKVFELNQKLTPEETQNVLNRVQTDAPLNERPSGNPFDTYKPEAGASPTRLRPEEMDQMEAIMRQTKEEGATIRNVAGKDVKAEYGLPHRQVTGKVSGSNQRREWMIDAESGKPIDVKEGYEWIQRTPEEIAAKAPQFVKDKATKELKQVREGTIQEFNSFQKLGPTAKGAKPESGFNFTEDPATLTYLMEKSNSNTAARHGFEQEIKNAGMKIPEDGKIPEGHREVRLPIGAENPFEGHAFPDRTAKFLERKYKMDNADPNELLEAYKSAQNKWKAMSTYWNIPTYHARNFTSDAFVNARENPRILTYTEPAFKVLREATFENKDPILKEYINQGLARSGKISGDIENVTKNISELGTKFGKAKGKLREFGDLMEDVPKLSQFMFLVKEKGLTAAEAAKKVREAHFDYRDLTPAEQKLKLLFPFYSWTRKSVPYNVKMLAQKPFATAGVGKLKDNLQSEANPFDTNVLSDQDVERNQIQLPGGEPGTGRFLNTQGYIPYSDAMTPLKPIQTVSDLLTPFVKAPLELANNRVLYTGQPIEKFPGQKTAAFSGVLGEHAPLIPMWLRYLMSQVSPVNTVERLSGERDPGTGWAQKLFELSAGIKPKTYNEQEQRGYQVNNSKREVQDIKNRIKNAKTQKERDYLTEILNERRAA